MNRVRLGGTKAAGFGGLRPRVWELGLACGLMLAASGRAQEAVGLVGSDGKDPGGAARAAASTVPDYVVTPEDVLDVYIFEVPEISRTYRVSPSGFINLPLLPQPVAAAGLSPSELASAIAERFRQARLLSDPQVSVSVRETRLHAVVVTGAVKHPMVYPVFGPIKLLDALSEAGGLTDDAGNKATVGRGPEATRFLGLEAADLGGDGPSSSVDVRRLLETGEESLNLVLYPGDRVAVERAGIIYVLGAVGRPGGYPLKDPQEKMTVLKALALAGDVTGSAKRSRLVILRRQERAPGGREELELDLKKIMAGRSPDTRLLADDILFVPENGKLKAVRQAVGVGVGMGAAIATGRAIYH